MIWLVGIGKKRGWNESFGQIHVIIPACNLNSHASDGEKCVEIIKTLHVKFFPSGAPAPSGSVTVKR